MADETDSREFLRQLQETGFFDQIRDLDRNIHAIAEDLKNFGRVATQRVQETENLATHLLAVEAVLTALLRVHPVDADAIRAQVREMTAKLTGNDDGSPAVHTVIDSILSRVNDKEETT